jgi:ATP-dependent exoDNAse (exonuclease V) alpha subunit
VDHAYAHTSFKEQGQTNMREIIAVSNTGAKVFNREASYVAATRAKDNTEVITTDYEGMLKNAGKEVKKTTASEVAPLKNNGLEHSELGRSVLELAKNDQQATKDRVVEAQKIDASVERSRGPEIGR